MARPNHVTKYKNLGFDPQQVDVRCFGIGGGRVVPGYKFIRDQVDLALGDDRTVFFIHIGENDLRSCEADYISDWVHQLISYLNSKPQVRFVCISQLLVFPKQQQYRDKVVAINKAVSEICCSLPKFLYCRHKGFWDWKPEKNPFAADQIHLNEEIGLPKYWDSVKYFVNFALRCTD